MPTLFPQVITESETTIPHLICPLPAGDSISVFDEYEDHDPAELITGGKSGIISCEITGDSMVPYIRNGDRVYIDPFREARTGDPVAAWVNGEVTAKFFEHSDKGLFLVASNGAKREITRKDNFKIIGVIEWFLGKAEKRRNGF